MKRYTTMIESDAYKAEIYDNCSATIEMRRDGERLRISVDGTYWEGNTGGYRRYVSYIDGRDAVKSYWRRLRQLQRRAVKNGDSPRNVTVLTLDYCW